MGEVSTAVLLMNSVQTLAVARVVQAQRYDGSLNPALAVARGLCLPPRNSCGCAGGGILVLISSRAHTELHRFGCVIERGVNGKIK